MPAKDIALKQSRVALGTRWHEMACFSRLFVNLLRVTRRRYQFTRSDGPTPCSDPLTPGIERGFRRLKQILSLLSGFQSSGPDRAVRFFMKRFPVTYAIQRAELDEPT